MPYEATMPYRIVVMCENCGFPLRVIKEGMGRGVYQYNIKKIHKTYGGKCPKCGKELSRRPRSMVFKTLKEASEYMDVDVKTTKRVTILMPVWLYDLITKLVREGKFKSRTELITKAIMKMLDEQKIHEVH
jgi:predicted nucleic-acid-binding Zn-ribbon protein